MCESSFGGRGKRYRILKNFGLRQVTIWVLVTTGGLLLAAGMGCQGGTKADASVPSPRDEAVQKAEEWEKKRYDDILKQTEIPVYGFRVIHEFPHDETAFTEGLVMDQGLLYEGTGLWDQSRLTATELLTGVAVEVHALEPRYFGEGITVLGDKIYQLTYQSCIGFVYGKDDFRLLNTFHFPGQGWGLTDDGEKLVMSNGSAALIFVDPQTMQISGSVIVSDQVGPVGNLNELEFVDGEIYANIFKTNLIAIISPETGAVTGWIDMNGINPDPTVLKDPFVLNGIAHDAQTGRLLVTGKCWPKLYEIELIKTR